nr:hypothetical protein [Tanacetum cinerariifolium]
MVVTTWSCGGCGLMMATMVVEWLLIVRVDRGSGDDRRRQEVEGKGKSATKADTKIDWGSEDDSHQSNDEHVNEGDITWLSTDEEEKGNEYDDDKDDDRSIDIEETDNERTYSKNGSRIIVATGGASLVIGGVRSGADPLTFDELMATPIDFSKFVKNQLKLDKITKAVLVGPIYNILKDTCQSSIELEYNMEECYKALSNRLDWTNPEEHFFNNDPEYLKSENIEKKYTTLITKTKDTRYELVRIEDMISKQWSTVKVCYNKDVAFKISHWGPKRQLFYRSQINRIFKHDVYSTVKILSVVRVKVDRKFSYGYLEEIMKKLNITNSQKDFPTISAKEPYTPSFDSQRVDYEDSSNRKRLMRANELYKFSDGTLKLVRDTIYHRLRNFILRYKKGIPRRKWSDTDQRRSDIMVKLIEE